MIKKNLLVGGLLLLLLVAAAALYITTAVPPLPPDTDEVIDQVLNSDLPQLVTGRTGFAQSDASAIWYEMLEPEGPPKGPILLIWGNV